MTKDGCQVGPNTGDGFFWLSTGTEVGMALVLAFRRSARSRRRRADPGVGGR